MKMAKYKDIADALRSKIMNGEYMPGEKMPYEYALCMTYHCNKETMKKALDILVKEGLIIRRRGAGTFVKDYDPDEKPRMMFKRSLSERMPHAKITSDIIAFEVIPCDEFLARKLQIEEYDFVYHIIRNRYVDGKPYVVSISYIPLSIVPNLKADVLKGSLYDYIQNVLKYSIQSAHVNIRALPSTAPEQDFLGINAGDPCIEEEQTTYLQTGAIFEYNLSRFRYETYEFATIIIRQ